MALLVAALTTAVAAAAPAADTSPPSQPGAISVSGLSSSSAVLKWGPSVDDVGIEGYRVYRGASVASLALIATTDGVASYSATDLRSASGYAFGVVAIDAAGNQSPMQTVELSTAASSDVTAPAAPSSSSVALRPFSSTRIDVVWAASSSPDVAAYSVFRGGVLVGTVEQPSSPRFSDNGLAASTSYSYTVQAIDSAGNRSALTTAKTARTMAPGAEAIARGPYLSNVTASSAVVSWWTNIATPGVLAIAGQSIIDPAGSVQHHAVTVTGLSAGTGYAYTVTSDAVSASGSLRTAALPGQAFSFAAIGDFGGGSPGEAQNAANIAGAGTQFIQTLGDNIYPAAGLPDPNFTTTYSDFDARFFKPFGPAVQSQAFFPANGNQEYYGDGEFWATFPMPGANHSWYSYDWGDAHILVLDSEQPYTPGSAQYSFAQADLAAHQADAWRIVVIPRPPYSSTSATSSSQATRQYLVPLFQSEHVDLVLSGNSHNYERTVPLTDDVPVASGGITYIVSGGGGNGFNAFGAYTQPWTAFRESSYYEYTRITVTPTSLTADAVRSDTNSVFDTTTIQRYATGGPPAGPIVAPPAAPVVTPLTTTDREQDGQEADVRRAEGEGQDPQEGPQGGSRPRLPGADPVPRLEEARPHGPRAVAQGR